MKKWEVTYYKHKNTISVKYVFADTAEQAIKKAKCKNIIDLQIVS